LAKKIYKEMIIWPSNLKKSMIRKSKYYESLECNTSLKQMKYLEHTLATYESIICNIQIKQLQLAT